MGDQDFVLLIFGHLVAFDNFSTGLIIQELGRAIDKIAAGSAFDLPPVELQFADYALWEYRWLGAEGERYDPWKQRLAAIAPIRLPLCAERPAKAVKLKRVDVPFTGESASQIRTLAREHGVTVPMVLSLIHI